MFLFTDKKHKKTIELSQSVLVNYSRALASGATLSFPQFAAGLSEVEQILGGFRQKPRNDYLGMVLTKPSNDSFFVGTTWIDHGDNEQRDEDLILFQEISPNNFNVERLRKSQVEKKFPSWSGYHHGDKLYLE